MGGFEANCARCGEEIGTGSPRDLCPRCLSILAAAEDGAGDRETAIEAPPDAFLPSPPAIPQHDNLEHQLIGDYKVLQKIGQGGFGNVYMADQLRPVKRRVALKVIKVGMDTEEVVARFEAERQALAMMDHPNIAKIFDAGATGSGRPYFAMELVKGIPITDFCDGQRLDTGARLELFRDVCLAVQHAHQKGIIHRDLKPNNVLVMFDGEKAIPKVIDFGIAKAIHQPLTEHTLVTRYGQVAGTPIYMSPEQSTMSGLDIDTRSDIYSLGVLLYVLLTGQTPFPQGDLASGGIDDFLRKVRELDPLKPSTRLNALAERELTELAKHRRSDPRQMRSLLRGDLDCIVMKAIEKDRTRRYDSASGLEQDIRRHLENQPISAAPPGLAYSLGKFARRNRKTLAAGVTVGLVLVLATIVSTWQAIAAVRARKSETAALAEAKAATALADENLVKSRQAAGKTWLSGARLMLEQKRFLSARVMAGKALGFEGFGRSWGGERFADANPVLLAPGSPEWMRAQRIVSGEFDYPLLWCQAVNDDFHVLKRIAVSPDGSLLASAGFDGKIRLWDAAKGVPVGEALGGHGEAAVWEVAFSPDGKFLVSAAVDGVAIIRDGRSGQELGRLTTNNPIMALAFHPDGKRLATAGLDPAVHLWDLESREQIGDPLVGQGKLNIVTDLCFDASGDRIATVGHDRTLRLWELQPSGIYTEVSVRKHQELLRAVAFHPDCSQIVSAGDAGEIHFWSVPELAKIETLPGHPLGVTALDFSPDGNLLASSGRDHQIKVWQVPTATLEATLEGHHDEVEDVAFGPDGASLTSCGKDRTVRLWDVARSLATVVRAAGPITSVEFLPGDGRLAASLGGGRVGLFDSATGQLLDEFCHQAEVESLQISRDGMTLVTGCLDHRIYLWDLRTGKLRSAPLSGHDGAVTCLEFSPDGTTLASGSIDKSIFLWDLSAQRQPVRLLHPDSVLSLAFSPTGNLLAAGVNDDTIHVWNLSGIPVEPATAPLRGHEGAVDHVAFNPAGTQLASSSAEDARNVVKLWSTTGWTCERDLPHDQRVRCIAYTPDGAFLAAGDENRQVRLWDVARGADVTVLEGHAGAVLGMSIAAGGDLLATCSTDGTARLWSLDPQAWNSTEHLLLANENFTQQNSSVSYGWTSLAVGETTTSGTSPLTSLPGTGGPGDHAGRFWQFLQAKNWRAAQLELDRQPGSADRQRHRSLAAALAAEARTNIARGQPRLASTQLARAKAAAADAPEVSCATALLLAGSDPAGARQALEQGLADADQLATTSAAEKARFETAWQLYQHLVRSDQIGPAGMVIERILKSASGRPAGVTNGDLLAPLIEHLIGQGLAVGGAEGERLLRVAAAAQIGDRLERGVPLQMSGIRALQELERAHDESVDTAARLVEWDADWKFFDRGQAPPAGWTGSGFDDGRWGSGPAPLGFGGDGEATPLRKIPADSPDGEPVVACYFRCAFDFKPPEGAANIGQMRIVIRLKCDDGAIVYLNGEEIVADNMPAGEVTYRTLAPESADETLVKEFDAPASGLRQGLNVFAAEVHQEKPSSSDLQFSLSASLKRVTAGSYFSTLASRDAPAVAQTLDDLQGFLPPSLAGDWRGRLEKLFLDGFPEDDAGRR